MAKQSPFWVFAFRKIPSSYYLFHFHTLLKSFSYQIMNFSSQAIAFPSIKSLITWPINLIIKNVKTIKGTFLVEIKILTKRSEGIPMPAISRFYLFSEIFE